MCPSNPALSRAKLQRAKTGSGMSDQKLNLLNKPYRASELLDRIAEAFAE